jgi:hypothetical protein
MVDQTVRTAESMSTEADAPPAQRTTGAVVRLRISTDSFVLRETLEAVPDAEFACEDVVENGSKTILPLVWARSAEPAALEKALASDASVRSASLLTELGDRRLYQMDWEDSAALLIQVATNARATILDLSGGAEGWTMRLLYPSRDALSDSLDFAESLDLSFEIRSICDVGGDGCQFAADDAGALNNYGLTPKQAAALEVAYESGYFEVPREVTVAELADELDVSHQALSERLRRGCQTLLRDTLMGDLAFETSGPA